MEAIEAEPTNETLKGVLPKNYARPTLDKTMLGELVDLFSNIKMHDMAPTGRETFWAEFMNTSFQWVRQRRRQARWRVLHAPLCRSHSR